MLYLKRQHDCLLAEIEKEKKIFKDIVLVILNFMFLNLYIYTS